VRPPEIVATYRTLVKRGITVLAKDEYVADARIANRRLLEDGRIVLTPDATHTAVCGELRFKDLLDGGRSTGRLPIATALGHFRSPRRLCGIVADAFGVGNRRELGAGDDRFREPNSMGRRSGFGRELACR
jgi:hypothetical protein